MNNNDAIFFIFSNFIDTKIWLITIQKIDL